MSRLILVLAFLLGLSLDGAAPQEEAWPAIPPEVWAIKDGQGDGAAGAVIVAERLRMTDTLFTRQCRIRICSERGKAAADLGAFPAETRNLAGRVVFPDGGIVSFDSLRDFQEKVWATAGEKEYRAKVLVPPGLTPDCVVDLRWEVPQHWQRLGLMDRTAIEFALARPFPVRTLVLELAKDRAFQWSFVGGSAREVAKKEVGGFMTLDLRDIPAIQPAAYSLDVLRDQPRLTVYSEDFLLTQAANNGPPYYWLECSKRWKAFFTGRITKGPAYAAFSKDLRAGLPAEPQALARELALRLQDQVVNLKALTFEERGAMTRSQAEERISPMDLESLATRRTAFPNGIVLAFVTLLREAGITPKLAMVADRKKHLFSQSLTSMGQFDDCLVGVDEPGKARIWVDPCIRFAAPTLVRPVYQGTRALELDTKDWDWRTVLLESQPASTNQRLDTYVLDLQPDGDAFSLRVDFRGYDDLAARRASANLEPREQGRALREEIEKNHRVWVSQATVEHAHDAHQSLVWHLEGRIDRAVGRIRRVEPFPLTPPALEPVKASPGPRIDTIVLPYLLERHAVSRFKVPEGWVWVRQEPVEHRSPFGTVSFKAEQETGPQGPEVVATLDVCVTCPSAPARQWPAFLEFLGWVQETGTATLVLERQR